MAKKYDAAVVTGTYVDKNGVEKKRYKNIGVVMEGKESGLYMLLERSFNPAGINSDRETIMVSFFAPKNEASQPTAHDEAKQDGYAPAPASAPVAIDDEIPF